MIRERGEMCGGTHWVNSQRLLGSEEIVPLWNLPQDLLINLPEDLLRLMSSALPPRRCMLHGKDLEPSQPRLVTPLPLSTIPAKSSRAALLSIPAIGSRVEPQMLTPQLTLILTLMLPTMPPLLPSPRPTPSKQLTPLPSPTTPTATTPPTPPSLPPPPMMPRLTLSKLPTLLLTTLTMPPRLPMRLPLRLMMSTISSKPKLKPPPTLTARLAKSKCERAKHLDL
mmetsp:Transcript_31732/g.79685  ORF Transcript_31732/g.79685 Transcript_31732/m.79685 type:complete len:225 (-) Transcript_31732:2154-2828(-)